ncbi:MAG TPA: calcium-binding protein, partial [Allosphingosinicella sp.]|nr:calcium-binding protein [Allosphingosinicella sp.]
MTVYHGTEGDDVITGTAGDDDFYSSNGNDLLTGDGGWDRIFVDLSLVGGDTFFRHFILRSVNTGVTGRFETGTGTTETSTIEEFNILAGLADDLFIVQLSDYAGPLKASIDGGAGGRDQVWLTLNRTGPAMIGTESGGTFVAGDLSFTNFEVIDIELGDGNDHLTLGDSSNGISGRGGDDYIDGGAGSDRLSGGAGSDILRGGDGNDFLSSSEHTLDPDVGSEFDDLSGGDGDDYILAGYGDKADGGAGSDRLSLTLRGATTGVTLDLPSLFAGATFSFGGGTVSGFETFSLIHGTDFADAIVTGSEAEVPPGADYEIFGHGGDDDITTGDQDETIGGGAGNDVIRAGGGGDYVTGDVGNDRLFGEGGDDFLHGGTGADELAGGQGDDVYSVDGGDLVIEAADSGIDIVHTGLGAYALTANVENLSGFGFGQALTGNALANRIVGTTGSDTLDGGDGADTLEGGTGNDRLIGGAGDDLLHYVAARFGTDAASVDGGAGTDTLFVSFPDSIQPAGLTRSLTANPLGGHDGWIANGAGDRVEFTGIEKFEISGTSAADSISGGSLDDILFGLGGVDVLDGGAGNDRLDGGGGADQLRGGLGDDIYDWADYNDTIVELAGEGTDEIRVFSFSFILAADAHVEKLTGISNEGQTLIGNGFANIVTGNTGNDWLNGGGGADTMRGAAGNDVYVVDNVADVVEENAGEGTDRIETMLASFSLAAFANVENLTAISDTNHDLRGNSGNNVITAGNGNDVLRLYDGGDDTVRGGTGNDNIFFIGSLTSADVVNGGADTDTLVLQGPYGALTLTANITQIENISILAGSNMNFGEPGTNRYDYVLTIDDANFAAGVQARINGAALLAGEDFTFDGSAETNANLVVYGGKGVDTLTGGLGNDIFFYAEERFATGDKVNGGAGYDGMFLRGNYTIDFNAPGYTGLFTNIENLTLTSATDERYARGGGTEFDYNLTLSNAIVNPGATLTVSGALLMATETMVLDASQETDGFLRLFGG